MVASRRSSLRRRKRARIGLSSAAKRIEDGADSLFDFSRGIGDLHGIFTPLPTKGRFGCPRRKVAYSVSTMKGFTSCCVTSKLRTRSRRREVISLPFAARIRLGRVRMGERKCWPMRRSDRATSRRLWGRAGAPAIWKQESVLATGPHRSDPFCFCGDARPPTAPLGALCAATAGAAARRAGGRPGARGRRPGSSSAGPPARRSRPRGPARCGRRR